MRFEYYVPGAIGCPPGTSITPWYRVGKWPSWRDIREICDEKGFLQLILPLTIKCGKEIVKLVPKYE